MSRNNYDRIAGAYDFLSRLIFQRAQVNAQIEQLKYLKAASSILIVGGGTGWILEELAKAQPSGLQITYVELSEQMLKLAQQRNVGANQVHFVHSSITEYSSKQQFDVIHTAFLFDNFKDSDASSVFKGLNKQLKAGGLWFYTDFKVDAGGNSWWKTALLGLMYAFFRRIAAVEAKDLPEMEGRFARGGLHIIEQKRYYKGFIESIIFQKSMKIPTFIENLES